MSLSVILSSSHVSTKHIKSGLLISQHKVKSSNFRTKLRQLKYRIEKHLLEGDDLFLMCVWGGGEWKECSEKEVYAVSR